jgi:hypothetical protein
MRKFGKDRRGNERKSRGSSSSIHHLNADKMNFELKVFGVGRPGTLNKAAKDSIYGVYKRGIEVVLYVYNIGKKKQLNNDKLGQVFMKRTGNWVCIPFLCSSLMEKCTALQQLLMMTKSPAKSQTNERTKKRKFAFSSFKK